MDWQSNAVAADEAVRLITSGMRVFIHGAAATPTPLLEALAARRDLEDVRLYHLHTMGPAPFAMPTVRTTLELFVSRVRRPFSNR